MATNADKSLDEYIKTRKQTNSRKFTNNRRGQRFNNRGLRRGRGGLRPPRKNLFNYANRKIGSNFKTNRRRGLRGQRNTIQLGGPMASSLLVSNLHYGVTDSDIHELFSEFGPLKRYGVHHNSQGQSLGTAEVIFISPNDTIKAIQSYQNVPLDGRAMKLQVAMSSFRITSQEEEENVLPEVGYSRGGVARGANIRRGGIGRSRPGMSRGGSARGGIRGRGRGRGRIPSLTELNDQLDIYNAESRKNINNDNQTEEKMD